MWRSYYVLRPEWYSNSQLYRWWALIVNMNEINHATIQSQLRRLLWDAECFTWNGNIYNSIVFFAYFSADRLRNGNWQQTVCFKINVTASFIRVISLITDEVLGHRTSQGSGKDQSHQIRLKYDTETLTWFERGTLSPRYRYSVVDLDSMSTIFSAKGWNINPYSTPHTFALKWSLIY